MPSGNPDLERFGVFDGDLDAVGVQQEGGVVFEVDGLQHLHQQPSTEKLIFRSK
jgi:hypothetical protein